VWVGEAGDHVHTVISFEAVGTLSIVDTKGEHAIITGSFQILRHDFFEPVAYMSRSPVEECTDVTLIPTATVHGIITVKCKAILAGLQVLKTIRDF